MTSPRWTALVLAGDRGPDEPVARLAGVPCKALAPVGGVPMLERVLAALRGCAAVGEIHLCGPRREHLAAWPALTEELRRGRLAWHAPQASAAGSVIAALAVLPAEHAVLITTADHALLTAAMVDFFLARAGASGLDAAVGLTPLTAVAQAFPGVRRTALRLRDGPWCGCNLFAVLTPAGRRAPAFWLEAEQVRKRPARLVRLLGVGTLARYVAGRLDAAAAFGRLSQRVGARVGMVALPYPEAAVDVDKPEDYALAERVLAARG